MTTKQPKWKLVAQLGDRNPIDHDGIFVYEDETGVYPPEVEVLKSLGDFGPWEVYRFTIEPCTYIDGILSDNKFHPEHPAWFAQPEKLRDGRPQDTTYLKNVADQESETVDAFAAHFLSANVRERAMAWVAVGEHHGFMNLDGDPLRFNTRDEVERRYANKV